MRLINRYCIKEFIPPMLVGIAFFTLIFILPKIRELVALTLEKDTPLSVVLELFVYTIPFTAAITIPMGTLFGVLFALGRMSSDSEIIALRASGVSLYSLARPTIAFGLVMTAFTFWFMNHVMPVTNFRYKTIYANILYSNPSILLESKQFSAIPQTRKKIAAVELSDDGQTMRAVYIYEKSEDAKTSTIIYAERGNWLNNTVNSAFVQLKLTKGQLLRLDNVNKTELQKLNFNELVVNVVNKIEQIEAASQGPREQSVYEVHRTIRHNQANQIEITPTLWIEYHKKYSIPLACLIFVIISFPLGISFERGGKGVSFGIAIILIFVYYILMTLGEVIGKRGLFNPVYSAYLPHFTLFALGVLLFFKKIRE